MSPVCRAECTWRVTDGRTADARVVLLDQDVRELRVDALVKFQVGFELFLPSQGN